MARELSLSSQTFNEQNDNFRIIFKAASAEYGLVGHQQLGKTVRGSLWSAVQPSAVSRVLVGIGR